MDPFVLIMLIVVGGIFIAVVLLGLFYPGSGAAQLDWRPTRSPRVEYENELDDIDQMTEAINARRRARGEAEITEEGLRAEVAADLRERIARADDHLAEEDIAQMLEATNARRRAKGEPELTREQLEREVLGP